MKVLRGPFRELAVILGSLKNLADAIGVLPRQVRRWTTGEQVPERPMRILLGALAKEHGVDPPYETTPVCPRPAWLDEAADEDDV